MDSSEPALESSASPGREMTVTLLYQFLRGSSDAIASLATHPSSLVVGALFVASAGLAREYDGEDLLHEPWHLLIPFAASIATSFVLFVIMDFIGWIHGSLRPDSGGTSANEAALRPMGFGSRYRIFLSLYWLTAPLAWLYAIPMERLFNEGDAASMNLWLLAIVAFWRVLLITQVCSILYKTSFATSFFPIMLFADTLAIQIMARIRVDILVMMGGVRLSESEIPLATAKLLVMTLGTLTWPVWAIGTLVILLKRAPRWTWTPAPWNSPAFVGRPVWLLAGSSITIWSMILPWTQPAQQLRQSVESAVKEGRFREAIDIMSAHQRSDFPSYWDPPPRIGFRDERQPILKIVAALKTEDAPWVRQLYFEKLNAALGGDRWYAHATLWTEGNVAEILSVLKQSSEGEAILKAKTESLRHSKHLFSDDACKLVNAELVRSAVPPTDCESGLWTDADSDRWSQFLGLLEDIEDPELIHEVHGERLQSLLDSKVAIPPWILERTQKLLKHD
ncbi:MAG: hypothetical protein JSS49_21905 [Planctomycetes bacterium]|nr:hypothetical protein [Planctomycetota bacterium]